MRYIDTGSRDPEQALGTWLRALAEEAELANELRVQSGFFGASSLGFIQEVLAAVGAARGDLRLVLGSNKGETTRSDLEILLEAIGPPRPGRRVVIVNFGNAFFHSKTIHLRRIDGTETAYVGSANLTSSGVRSLHVEAGIILDTRESDPLDVTQQIATATDWWFAAPRAGAYPIESVSDIESLEASGLVGIVGPKSAKSRSAGGASKGRQPVLAPLVTPPSFVLSKGTPTEPDETPSAPWPLPSGTGPVASVAATYWKTVTQSDAQRKAAGNQRGSITLTGREAKVNTQTYFRFDLFANVGWSTQKTQTGEVLEIASVPMRVVLDGEDQGTLVMPLSYAPNREEGQNNYTSLLHLGPLASYFREVDVTGWTMTVERLEDDTFQLTLAP